MADDKDTLSNEDLLALHQTYVHLQSAGDPRAEKLRQYLVVAGQQALKNPDANQTQFEKDRATAVAESQAVRNPWAEVGHIIPGAVGSAVKEVGNLAKSVPGALTGAMESGGGPVGVSNAVQMAGKIAGEDVERQAAARSVPYRVVAGAGTAAGVNAKGMEDAADVGDTSKVLGIAAGDAAPVVAGEALRTPKVQEVVGNAASGLKGMADFESKQAMTMRKVIPEAASLPDKAIAGAEDIFRAAAPTGMNKGFRANLYAAAPDLADIARKVDIAESKGGIVNPDMRVRATVDAIRDHLDEMYQTERAPQIEAHANVPMKVGTTPDAIRGLEYLENTAGTEQIRNLATKALGDIQEKGQRGPAQTLTLAEADQLAQAANQNLKTFERMTPEGKTQASITNPKIGGLKSLDQELGRKMNDVLTQNGEVGLRDYERRYAGISAVRDQLESRMNAVELERQSLGKYAKVATGGKEGIASASQAAVSSVNIGRKLQNGFGKLRDSGITAKK